MRKKYISKTYLCGVSDWFFIMQKHKLENYYVSIKKINEIDNPFLVDINGKSVIYIDNGYYIVEITPLELFYNIRVFLDENADVIGYYFDVSRGNGIEDNIPYYDDLYLDIVYSPGDNNFIEILDEDELLEALNTGKITREDFDFANKVCSNLYKEILENQNVFINMDKKKMIQRWFN